MNTPTLPPLGDWLKQAWNEHAERPNQVAQALQNRAALLPGDAEGLEALRLAEHVMLTHLTDPQALEAFVQALPPQTAFEPFLQRLRWTLAVLAGQTPADIPAAARWRALHGLAMVWLARGEAARAVQQLEADRAAAEATDDLDAVKGFAIGSHNLAQDLQFGQHPTEAHGHLMLAAAQASRAAWARAGDWMAIERADYRLACCHAVLGQGGPALEHARACLAACEANGADAGERFFAHEALVLAHRSAGDEVSARAERARMQVLLGDVEDAGLRSFCEETLAKL